MELMFIYNLRRQLSSGKVEEVGNFPVVVYVDDDFNDDVLPAEVIIDSMRDALEGTRGVKLFGLTVGDVWVTHIESEFNPFTFDINGQTYFCVQNLDPAVVESFFER